MDIVGNNTRIIEVSMSTSHLLAQMIDTEWSMQSSISILHRLTVEGRDIDAMQYVLLAIY